ncbi:ATP-binding cassette domain-containing protein [Arenicella sp. 4NH20-0111]|uniref:phosphonate C-P lyase system protein PhnL n=1 Tax=Arenicella sp. 4NH20-0111 TaxID=3127648 RepID=UPI003104EC33
MKETVLKIENFSKSFEMHDQSKLIPSSSNVNLSVVAGKLTALVGPTGAGKSTVLKSIYRTYLPSSGRLLYTTRTSNTIDLALADDHQILGLRENEIGFVTQFLRALPRQSSENIVAAPLIRKGVDKSLAIEAARKMLQNLDLPERLWQLSPATFSGGEKQRVNLARGFVCEPRLLLLDEPTASLDEETAERVITQINALKNRGTAILAIFHSPQLIKRLGDITVELRSPVDPDTLVQRRH